MDKLLSFHFIEEEREAQNNPVIGEAGTLGAVSWTLIYNRNLKLTHD